MSNKETSLTINLIKSLYSIVQKKKKNSKQFRVFKLMILQGRCLARRVIFFRTSQCEI